MPCNTLNKAYNHKDVLQRPLESALFFFVFLFGFPSVANQVMVLGQERSLHWPIPCSLRRVVTGWSDPDDAMVCRGVVWGVGVFLALDVTWILSRGVRINHT
jgi:hypothetical protein